MTQEEKQLLLKDLCARLPYGVICNLYDVEDANKKFQLKELSNLIISAVNSGCIKPYLHPMSSMTEEEIFEFIQIHERVLGIGEKKYSCVLSLEQMDWLNKNGFDYRELIPMGLALEAPVEMYKTE